MEKARSWIYSKGRDLEITIFNAIFDNEKEDVLTSLTLYLGEDGGFGNQLYYNAVGSSIFETFYALKILIDVNYDILDEGIIDDAFTYLFKNKIEDSCYLAGCVGAGLKLLNKDSINYKKCLELQDKVINDYKADELELIKSYVLFVDATNNEEIKEKLKKDLYTYISLSDTNPFDIIVNKTLVNDDLKPIVDKYLNDILESRISTGAWCYIDIDDIETIKKSGTLTVKNMLILKNFNIL